MRARRSESVAALVVAAGALLLTCVFGSLTFVPGIDPEIGGFLEIGLFVAAVVTLGALIVYVVMSRRTRSGEALTPYDRLLDQKQAALSAVPIGMMAVLIGVIWFMLRTSGDTSKLEQLPGADQFAAIDTAGITAFLGFGTLYVIGATYLAIRAERKALHLARADVEVLPS